MTDRPKCRIFLNSCGRAHEECEACALQTVEPPKCDGHKAGPVACELFVCRAAVLLGQRNKGKKKHITPELAKAMRDRLTARRARRWMVLRDDDGKRVKAGDAVRFCYGIPPVAVVAQVVERGGRLIALTPGHTPEECSLRALRRAVGRWYKDGV
jgi:hypothetical protein